ncbi:MAG: carbohydrate ABC transporter permease [Pleomorphochaeta sp.]
MANHKTNKIALIIFKYLLMILVALVSIVPFVWLLSTALKSQGENIFSMPPQFIPEQATLSNFVMVFKTIPMFRYYINSFIVVAFCVVLNILLSVSAAYPLARMKFKGKETIFFLILATMMIPIQLTMIPNFVTIVHLGLKDSLAAVILPNAVTAFGVFLIRQAMITVPISLEESAFIDGASSFTVLRHIVVPIIKPTLSALAIFTFINMWSDFLWPLLVLDSQKLYTVPLGVQKLQGTFTNDWRLVASGALLAIIPVMIFFIFNQKNFIDEGIASAVKG